MLVITIKNKQWQFGKLFFFGFLLFCLFKPDLAFAAKTSLLISNPQIAVGDTAMVEVIIDTEGQSANVVEGEINIESASPILIRELSMAGSALSLWPRKPSLAENGQSISFVGGAPGGFNKSGARLLRIVFLAEFAGQIKFTPANFKVYANDGKATPLETSIESLTVKINPAVGQPVKDEWKNIISQDKLPPTDLTAVIGQDSSMFEGQKFLVITAVDAQSGIDHYEVQEGIWPVVRTGSIFVLRDQGGQSDILVFAYDKAGNFSQILVRPPQPKVSYLPLIIFIIVLIKVIIVAIKIIRRIIKKKQKNNVHPAP